LGFFAFGARRWPPSGESVGARLPAQSGPPGWRCRP